MKKLMCILAGVAFACAANASSVNWGLATGNILDSTKVDTGTAYLCYTIGTLDWSALDTMTSFDASSLAAVGFTATLDTFSYSSDKLSNITSIIPSTSIGDATIGAGPKKLYVVIIDDGGKDIAYTAASSTVNVQNNTMNAPVLKTSSAFTYAEAATESVPEPTSGLLLLIGVAGLALKRKRA